jgi:hypothetical protein
MILDFIDLSSDDDKVVAQYVDLTSDEDDFEREHLAYGQGDAAQGITFLKQEFVADDGQAEAAQCTGTLQMQELGAYDGQANAAQSTNTMQELTVDDGQGDAAQGTATLQVQSTPKSRTTTTLLSPLPLPMHTRPLRVQCRPGEMVCRCFASFACRHVCALNVVVRLRCRCWLRRQRRQRPRNRICCLK